MIFQHHVKSKDFLEDSRSKGWRISSYVWIISYRNIERSVKLLCRLIAWSKYSHYFSKYSKTLCISPPFVVDLKLSKQRSLHVGSDFRGTLISAKFKRELNTF